MISNIIKEDKTIYDIIKSQDANDAEISKEKEDHSQKTSDTDNFLKGVNKNKDWQKRDKTCAARAIGFLVGNLTKDGLEVLEVIDRNNDRFNNDNRPPEGEFKITHIGDGKGGFIEVGVNDADKISDYFGLPNHNIKYKISINGDVQDKTYQFNNTNNKNCLYAFEQNGNPYLLSEELATQGEQSPEINEVINATIELGKTPNTSLHLKEHLKEKITALKLPTPDQIGFSTH